MSDKSPCSDVPVLVLDRFNCFPQERIRDLSKPLGQKSGA